jgi:hypothetical protein
MMGSVTCVCLCLIQVLMMTDSELKQLQQAEQEEQQEIAAAAASSKRQHDNSPAQPAVTLNLGRDMLEDEFGELCGAVLLQVRGNRPVAATGLFCHICLRSTVAVADMSVRNSPPTLGKGGTRWGVSRPPPLLQKGAQGEGLSCPPPPPQK